jgi:dihydroneopterin aldolase
MARIKISDLEVYYRVGVTDEERARPQRLLLTIVLSGDFSKAETSDDLTTTIDYAKVAQVLIQYGERRSWNLLEKLASNLADMILDTFKPRAVTVEVKKFVIPQAQYVSVSLVRTRRL